MEDPSAGNRLHDSRSWLGKSLPEEQVFVSPHPFANNVKLGSIEFRQIKLKFKLGLVLELVWPSAGVKAF